MLPLSDSKQFTQPNERQIMNGIEHFQIELQAKWKQLNPKDTRTSIADSAPKIKVFCKQYKFEFNKAALEAIGNPSALNAFVDTELGYIKFTPGTTLRLKNDYKKRSSVTSSALAFLAELPKEGIFIENVEIANDALYVRVKDWPLIEQYG